MNRVSPNDAASAGSQDIQNAIAKLDALRTVPGADVVAIDRKIDDLQAQDAALVNLQLQAMIDAQQFNREVAALNAAAGTLKNEAANMTVAVNDLSTVAQVVSAAASLVAALTPFI
ncbi:MAG TPA: hypothetical protein VMB73_23755 [Acetobacteraceae bacterium]|jgi:hypothetical protein|nr:hypothetical protein [Acetobacteraceae bacterium]